MKRSVWLWRWRPNPLRRRSYVVEAWALVAVVVVTLAVAGLTAVAVTRAVDHTMARQRTARHMVTAVLTERASASSLYAPAPQAHVRWTAPDGTAHTGLATVRYGLQRGAAVSVWTDPRGTALVPAPPDNGTARAEAVGFGVAAGTGICMLSFTGWVLVAQLTERCRAECWAHEWADIGPRGNHRAA